ncbi:MAG: ATP synthase F0 subunit B [Oscillospiraceae bacterium]|nr:ATP synthase F0 subunit B [Oscillospiraceae bacterium]
MEFHPLDVIISLINITVLVILLRLILWKHIYNFLSKREQRVRSEFESIEKRRLDADALRVEYEEKLESLDATQRDQMRESQIKASAEAEEILNEARDKAKTMMDDARERIAEEKERAIVDARNEVAQLATDMAARILKREVSSEDSIVAVNDFFS